MVKATKAVKTKTKAATKRGKAPQTSKPGRGRGREVDPSVRVRWRAEEDALVERLRGEGQTWPQIAEAVSRLGTQRGSAACMQRMIYLAAKRERGTLTLAPRSDGRIEVDVALFGQVIHVTTSRTLEQILGYLAGAA